MKDIAVIAVSGGMDSCVTAAIASLDHRLAFAHINYGQRTEEKELQCFHKLADHYNAEKRLVIDLRHLSVIGGSSLTDHNIDVSAANLDNLDIPTSYVPFRNSNILAVCTSWAEVIGAKWVYIGAVNEDSSGYPDCRPEFYEAFQRVIDTGTKPDSGIRIATPVINFTKDQIVKRGIELKAPLEYTWSCYSSDEKACGECDSCALRLRGFQKAGFDDPIAYHKKPIYYKG